MGLSNLWRHVWSALLLSTPPPLHCLNLHKCDTFLYLLWIILHNVSKVGKQCDQISRFATSPFGHCRTNSSLTWDGLFVAPQTGQSYFKIVSYFCFCLFSNDKYSTNTINVKSIDSVLRTRIRGSKMVGADESTELWRSTLFCRFFSSRDEGGGRPFQYKKWAKMRK